MFLLQVNHEHKLYMPTQPYGLQLAALRAADYKFVVQMLYWVLGDCTMFFKERFAILIANVLKTCDFIGRYVFHRSSWVWTRERATVFVRHVNLLGRTIKEAFELVADNLKIKLHLLCHLMMNLLHFGDLANFDAQSAESSHKDLVASTFQQATKRRDASLAYEMLMSYNIDSLLQSVHHVFPPIKLRENKRKRDEDGEEDANIEVQGVIGVALAGQLVEPNNKRWGASGLRRWSWTGDSEGSLVKHTDLPYASNAARKKHYPLFEANNLRWYGDMIITRLDDKRGLNVLHDYFPRETTGQHCLYYSLCSSNY
jgi:hypothetical protein